MAMPLVLHVFYHGDGATCNDILCQKLVNGFLEKHLLTWFHLIFSDAE